MKTVLEKFLFDEIGDLKEVNKAHCDLNKKLQEKIYQLESNYSDLTKYVEREIEANNKKQTYATTDENVTFFKSKREAFEEMLRYMNK